MKNRFHLLLYLGVLSLIFVVSRSKLIQGSSLDQQQRNNDREASKQKSWREICQLESSSELTGTTPHCFHIFPVTLSTCHKTDLSLGNSCPFTSALTFPLSVFVLLLVSPHLDTTQILLCSPNSVQHHSQSPIKAKSLSLFCFAVYSQSPISAVVNVRETVHVAKSLNPPLLCFCCLGLAIPPPSLLAIYIWVSKFFHSYTV